MGLSTQQQRFVEEYTKDFNATQAAIRAEYSPRTARQQGSRLLTNVDIAEAIAERVKEKTLSADQLLMMQSEIATLDIGKYIKGYGPLAAIDIDKLVEDGYGHLIKSVKYTASGATVYEFYDKQRAQEKLLSALEPTIGTDDRPFTIKIKYDD